MASAEGSAIAAIHEFLAHAIVSLHVAAVSATSPRLRWNPEDGCGPAENESRLSDWNSNPQAQKSRAITSV